MTPAYHLRISVCIWRYGKNGRITVSNNRCPSFVRSWCRFVKLPVLIPIIKSYASCMSMVTYDTFPPIIIFWGASCISLKSKSDQMPAEIITKEDLENFRVQLLTDIKNTIETKLQNLPDQPEGYRTSDVRKILKCSVNKLVSLRITRKLRTKKIGGTLYYSKEDIKRLMEEGY